MIKNITAGTGITINHAHVSWPAFYNTSSTTGNTLIGQVRYNGSGQNLEVYDGVNWITLTSAYPSIELSGDVQSIVNWARRKMAEESRIQELAQKNPAVADALEAVKQAEEQVKVVAALCDVK